ncbi:MAG: hypothetical protein FJX48_13450 [Alphaproteobacteria bacterium]|nr:hypothetical protein [Alphaproteobacteria bacterium]
MKGNEPTAAPSRHNAAQATESTAFSPPACYNLSGAERFSSVAAAAQRGANFGYVLARFKPRRRSTERRRQKGRQKAQELIKRRDDADGVMIAALCFYGALG